MSAIVPINVSGLSELVDQYDGYIIDLWGTIHNGVALFKGAMACLEMLHKCGKKVVLLSNAPRPAHSVMTQLEGFGIPCTLYHTLITSGEETYRYLKERTDPWFARLGQRVLPLGGTHDLVLYEQLPLQRVVSVDEADFIVCTGPDLERGASSLDPYLPELRVALTRGLPMICANPDKIVVKGDQRLICAGAMAAFYEEQGGDVFWIGKPCPAIYTRVLDRLAMKKERILAIGDAWETDIKGAMSTGVASVWVLSGVDHMSQEEAIKKAKIYSYEKNLRIMPRLQWT
ncbi:MAG: TIGR01459 family HAD-type hydrolase [Acetobacter sp.]|nr:TIGR01459 family HAD-type hydrolase [Acetobacter sp.]